MLEAREECESISSHETDGFHVLYREGHDLVHTTTHDVAIECLSPEDVEENAFACLPVTPVISCTSTPCR